MRKQTRRPCCSRWPPPHQRLHPPHSEPTRISRSWCEHQCLPVTCERRFLLVERLGALSCHQILVFIVCGVHPENETRKQGKQSLGRQDVHTQTTRFPPGG